MGGGRIKTPFSETYGGNFNKSSGHVLIWFEFCFSGRRTCDVATDSFSENGEKLTGESKYDKMELFAEPVDEARSVSLS